MLKNKPTVYLGKSNACNPDFLMKARKVLGRMDCDIVEWNGGTYNATDMLTCDMLVMLPHPEQDDAPPNSFYIGRGQYEQIKSFFNKGSALEFDNRPPIKNVFIVSNIGSEYIYVDEVTEIETDDENNWKLRYGLAYTNQAQINLNNYGVHKLIETNKAPNFPINVPNKHPWSNPGTDDFYTYYNEKWIKVPNGLNFEDFWLLLDNGHTAGYLHTLSYEEIHKLKAKIRSEDSANQTKKPNLRLAASLRLNNR